MPIGAAAHWLLEIGPNNGLLDEPTVAAVPRRDGSWSATFAIPTEALNVQDGEYSFTVFCGTLDRDDTVGEFLYDAGTFVFDVTGPDFVAPSIETTPAAGPPGTVISFIGDRCHEKEAAVRIVQDMQPVADLHVPVAPDGTFKGTFAIPAKATVGYPALVFAGCGHLSYPSAEVAVTAG